MFFNENGYCPDTERMLSLMKKLFLCLAVMMLMFACISASAESTTIPVVSLDGDCLNDYTNWNDKSTYYPVTITYTDGDTTFTQEIEIKPQGTSSLLYPKKNFTVKLSESVEMAETWGAQKKYVLKADYIDPTHCVNVVAAKLAAQINREYGILVDAPNYGVIDGFPVFVRINGEDAGIYNWTIPKDAWMFNMDADNPNHLVLCCEGFTPACKLQTAEIDYELDWTFEVGEATDESKAAFERMVEFVSTADDKTFVEEFDQYLDLDSCLNYICFITTAYANDNICKNLLMATYDGKVWYPVLYDLDSLWGVDPYGTRIIASEESNAFWVGGPKDNYLFKRVSELFGDQLRERYWKLREGILSQENILESMRAYTAQIPQEYYDIDRALWNADGKHIRTIDLMEQLMDGYLPIVDSYFEEKTAEQPAMHYVWNGMQQQTGSTEDLPVSMTISYQLDGQPISEQELAGKSGRVEVMLRVERKSYVEPIYGVAALVHVEKAQCENITVTGGTYTDTAQEYVCMGSAGLGDTNNVYEIQLSMDVTGFDPAKYMVVASPLYIDGGGEDYSLDALLATAGELNAIINDGLLLHESMVEWHEYLTSIHNSLTMTTASVQKLLPSETENDQEDAGSIMQKLLADAETAADAMLTEFGYEVAADAAAADRVLLLSEIAADAERTEEEKNRASEQLKLIENYLVVAGRLEETQKIADEINTSLTPVMKNLPDLVSAYSYANDALYGLLYRITTLYQNLANYYYSYDGGDVDFTDFSDWYDVVIFSNFVEIDQL